MSPRSTRNASATPDHLVGLGQDRVRRLLAVVDRPAAPRGSRCTPRRRGRLSTSAPSGGLGHTGHGRRTENTATTEPHQGCSNAHRPPTEDEGEHEAEERERFGERDAEEHGRSHHAGRFGLAGHRGDGVADHDADADARADGRAAVDDASTDGLETGRELTGLLDCEEQSNDLTQHLFLLIARVLVLGVHVTPPMYTAVRIVKMNACRTATRTSKPVSATSSPNGERQQDHGDASPRTGRRTAART